MSDEETQTVELVRGALIEGEPRKAGDKVRVSVKLARQLVDAGKAKGEPRKAPANGGGEETAAGTGGASKRGAK